MDLAFIKVKASANTGYIYQVLNCLSALLSNSDFYPHTTAKEMMADIKLHHSCVELNCHIHTLVTHTASNLQSAPTIIRLVTVPKIPL